MSHCAWGLFTPVAADPARPLRPQEQEHDAGEHHARDAPPVIATVLPHKAMPSASTNSGVAQSWLAATAVGCRYITRPALTNARVSCNAAGLVVLNLKARRHDGTSHLVMSPLELMQRLAALVPHPRPPAPR